jgi:spore coat protein H
MPSRRKILVFVATVLASLAASAASAQTPADFFNDNTVKEVRLRVNRLDWAALKAHPELNTYYPADVAWNGIVVRNAGVRSRGNGTRNGVKPGLRIDINRYVANQQFVGLNAFILDNAYTDASHVRESVAMKLFARLQVPAPREAHARLYVNDQYVGAYVIVEEINRTFISRVFGEREANVEAGGYLFEYHYRYPYGFEYLGPGLEPYAEIFEPQTRDTDSVANIYGPVEEMIRAVNESPADDFAGSVGRYLDLDLLMKYLAVESFLDETDGLTGDWAANNFYLYRFRQSDRAQFIPWDKDHTFQNVTTPVTGRLSRGVLVPRALAVPEFRQKYLEALAQCVAFSQEAAGDDPRGWLEREVERQSQLVAAAVAQDPVSPYSFDQFRADVDGMLTFARLRPGVAACEASQLDQRFGDPGQCAVPSSTGDDGAAGTMFARSIRR